MTNQSERDDGRRRGAPTTSWERVLTTALFLGTVLAIVWLVTR